MATFGMLLGVRRLSTTSASLGKLVSTPISVYGTEGRYASAIYSAATKEKKLEQVEQDLKKVRGWMEKDVKFADYVLDPTQRKTEKIKHLDAVLSKQGCTSLTVNLMASLAENGRLRKLGAVISTFERLMSAHRGQVIAKITTAKALDASSAKELETALQGFLAKGQTLQLTAEVDPALVGGMVVTIGDKYIDMSMATKIKTYTDVIKQAV